LRDVGRNIDEADEADFVDFGGEDVHGGRMILHRRRWKFRSFAGGSRAAADRFGGDVLAELKREQGSRTPN
jgi:hypothetical protein